MSPGPGRRRWRGLVAVLAAQAAAWTGTRLSAIALPWFVLTTSGSAVQTGLVVFAEMAPYVIVQALAGPVIDRVGPRRISIAGDLLSMATVAAIPLLYAFGVLHIALLLPLVAVVGACRGPSDAAKAIFIPDVTAAADVPLERGTGLSGTIERLASTVGPAVAGVVVAALGGPYALVITATLFGLGAAVIARYAPSPGRSGAGAATESYLTRLRGGVTFLRQDRLLRSITVIVAVTNLLDTAWVSVLLPVWARDTGHGPAVIGLVLGVMSASAIASSLLAAAIAHRLPRRIVFLSGFLISGAPRFLVLALGAPLWLVIGVYALAGFAGGFLNPILGAVQFERAPREMLGRVRTLIVAVSWSGIPFGGLIGGALVALAGLAPALLICAVSYLTATTAPMLGREWAEMDRNRRPPGQPPSPQPSAQDQPPQDQPAPPGQRPAAVRELADTA